MNSTTMKTTTTRWKTQLLSSVPTYRIKLIILIRKQSKTNFMLLLLAEAMMSKFNTNTKNIKNNFRIVMNLKERKIIRVMRVQIKKQMIKS